MKLRVDCRCRYLGESCESCEHLSLRPKAFSEEVGRLWHVDDLDCHLLFGLSVSTWRTIDSIHAAASNQAGSDVRTG